VYTVYAPTWIKVDQRILLLELLIESELNRTYFERAKIIQNLLCNSVFLTILQIQGESRETDVLMFLEVF